MIFNQTNIINSDWVRPSNWLQRPDIADDEYVIYMLCKITSADTIDNYVSFITQGATTVEFGDSTTTNYASAARVDYEIQYSGATDYFGDGSDDKQCWLKIYPQAANTLTRFNTYYKTVNNTSANNCVLEVLVGKTDNIAGAYAFSLPNLHYCQSIKFYETLTYANFAQQLFFGNVSLQNVELSVSSQYYNPSMFTNTVKLKDYSKINFIDFGGTITSCFQNTGADELVITGGTNLSNSQYLIASNRTIRRLHVNSFGTGSYGACQDCYSLEDCVVDDEGSASTMYAYSFYACVSIKETPVLNLTSSTNNSLMFYNCYNLRASNLKNIKASIDFRYCNLNHDAIYDIVNNQLATVVSQNLDVRYNPDVTNLPTGTTALAATKGWTVTIA